MNLAPPTKITIGAAAIIVSISELNFHRRSCVSSNGSGVRDTESDNYF